VTLLHRSDEFKADPITVQKVLENPKMHAILNAEILSVEGDKAVTGLAYRTKEKPEKQTLPVQGIFVEIGSVPSTESVKGLVTLDAYGQIVVDPRNQRSSVVGIWAAGDITDGLYHQNNIAAGDAVKALEDIYLFLHASK
jgi:alkyl hydroperoxide reductase subunit F